MVKKQTPSKPTRSQRIVNKTKDTLSDNDQPATFLRKSKRQSVKRQQKLTDFSSPSAASPGRTNTTYDEDRGQVSPYANGLANLSAGIAFVNKKLDESKKAILARKDQLIESSGKPNTHTEIDAAVKEQTSKEYNLSEVLAPIDTVNEELSDEIHKFTEECNNTNTVDIEHHSSAIVKEEKNDDYSMDSPTAKKLGYDMTDKEVQEFRRQASLESQQYHESLANKFKSNDEDSWNSASDSSMASLKDTDDESIHGGLMTEEQDPVTQESGQMDNRDLNLDSMDDDKDQDYVPDDNDNVITPEKEKKGET